MKILLVLALFMFTGKAFAQDTLKKQVKQEEIFSELEQMPEFPGGPEAMQAFLEKNINYPAKVRGACASGKIIVRFIVKEDGTVSRAEIVKSINGCPDFDYEVYRVIKLMPKWIPGKLKGKSVKCYYKLPVYIN